MFVVAGAFLLVSEVVTLLGEYTPVVTEAVFLLFALGAGLFGVAHLRDGSLSTGTGYRLPSEPGAGSDAHLTHDQRA